MLRAARQTEGILLQIAVLDVSEVSKLQGAAACGIPWGPRHPLETLKPVELEYL
jgi:hypothetical protein